MDGTEAQTDQNSVTSDQSSATADTQNSDSATSTASDTGADTSTSDPFADLDADTREWLTKREIKDPKGAAKLAHEQSKLLGNAIRIPGKDAKPEERDAFLNKLGRPETKDGYDFEVPKDLPENMPYDAERATGFKDLAHSIGLTKAQAAAIHDWAATNAVQDYNGLTTKSAEQNAEIAKSETQKLEKLWGPLKGDQMKANLSYADTALREVGGEDALKEFQRVGLIGKEGNVILSAPIAVMMAKFGQAVFKEADVLKGRADRLDNPFVEGKSFNMTAQMKLIKEDREQALAFISAAGKTPADFGLKG